MVNSETGSGEIPPTCLAHSVAFADFRSDLKWLIEHSKETQQIQKDQAKDIKDLTASVSKIQTKIDVFDIRMNAAEKFKEDATSKLEDLDAIKNKAQGGYIAVIGTGLAASIFASLLTYYASVKAYDSRIQDIYISKNRSFSQVIQEQQNRHN